MLNNKLNFYICTTNPKSGHKKKQFEQDFGQICKYTAGLWLELNFRKALIIDKKINISWHLPSLADVASVSTTMLKQWMKSCEAAVMYSVSTADCKLFRSWSTPLTDSASDDSSSLACWWLYVVILVNVTSCASCFTEIKQQITLNQFG